MAAAHVDSVADEVSSDKPAVERPALHGERRAAADARSDHKLLRAIVRIDLWRARVFRQIDLQCRGRAHRAVFRSGGRHSILPG